MTKPALVNSRNTSNRVPVELSRIGICGRLFVGFPPVEIVEPVRSSKPASGTWRTIALPGLDGSDTEAAWTTALAAHLGGEAEQQIGGIGRSLMTTELRLLTT